MALRTPPSWLQNGSHPAENDRLTMQAIFASTGIVGSSSLAVTQIGTPTMAVQVAAGWGAIVGNSTSNMGAYTFYNDAATTLTITTANATLPRIDLVCVTVNDSYYSGATNNVTFQVIAGTPAASPVAPTLPSNSLSLATVAVAAAATSIVNANITDARVNVGLNIPVGDITAVNAGTNLSGGGTSGDVTLNLGVLKNASELATVTATAATGTVNYNALTQSILYYTTNASANFTLNFRGDGTTSLNSLMAVGDTKTFVFLNTNGTTAYYANGFQIDGSSVTPKWQGGTAPTSGNASAVDSYTFSIVKTAATPTYTVFASLVKFV